MPKVFSSVRLFGKYFVETGEKWRWSFNGPSNVWSFLIQNWKNSIYLFIYQIKCLVLGEEISSLGCDCCSGTHKVTENPGTHAPEHYKSPKAPRWGRDLLTVMTRWAGSDRTARPRLFSPASAPVCALLLLRCRWLQPLVSLWRGGGQLGTVGPSGSPPSHFQPWERAMGGRRCGWFRFSPPFIFLGWP